MTASPSASDIKTVERAAGFYAIPGALTAEEQQVLAVEAFTTFPAEPAATNWTAQYGMLPVGLWQAAEADLHLARPAVPDDCSHDQLTADSLDVPQEAALDSLLAQEDEREGRCSPVPARLEPRTDHA